MTKARPGHDDDSNDPPAGLGIDFDLAGKIKEEDAKEDCSTAVPVSPEQDDRLWASLRRYPSRSNVDDIIARSPSIDCIKTLMRSLMPQYKEKLENAPKTRFGLPTLG